MKVKVRKRKPAPVAAEQAPKAIYIVKRELNGKFDVPHHVEFDDYTAPVPSEAEPTIMKLLASSDPDLYSAIQKAISSKKQASKQMCADRIPEADFIAIINELYDMVHHPIVANAKAKTYPNLTILEYADFFEI